MKHQMKQMLIVSACMLLSVTAKANCQWTSVGSLTHEVQTAQDLLTRYGPCKTDCKPLAVQLEAKLSQMSEASACPPHIMTPANRQLLSFVSSRYRLIKKQKSGQSWTQTATAKAPAAAPVTPVASAPQATNTRPPAPTPVVITKHAPIAPQETTMVISQAAYKALWLDDDMTANTAPVAQPVRPQASQQTMQQQEAARLHAIHEATQAQRQQIQLRNQALLQQQRLQQAYAQKRQLQIQQNQQRMLKRRRELQQAREQHWQQQRIRQQELAQARGN